MVLRSRSLHILLLCLSYLLLAPYLPVVCGQVLYSVSLSLKDLLMWCIPLTAFFFIADAIASFKQKAPYFVSLLLGFEAVSNFVSLWFAFAAGAFFLQYAPSLDLFEPTKEGCRVLFRFFPFKPSWWSADKGALMGILCGTLAGFLSIPPLSDSLKFGKQFSQKLLTHGFSKVIPLFVLGFVANAHISDIFGPLIKEGSFLVVQLILILMFYLFFLFFIASKGSLFQMLKGLIALCPAGLMALMSGCSLSTMPWTIRGCEKILQNPSLASSIIPATTNIQQIGDCITNSFLCYLIYAANFGRPPCSKTWLIFAVMFTLARFATAAVLGGAIFLMLPIYEKYLSFNPEMIALILALNIFLDPIVTASNVVANGALCKLFEQIWIKAMQLSKIETKRGSL